MKRLFVILLALVMCLSIAPIAFAADMEGTTTTLNNESNLVVDDEGWVLLGTADVAEDGTTIVPYGGNETWPLTGWNYKPVGSFTMQGNNLTPVKTLDPTAVGPMNLDIGAQYTCSTPVRLTVQIRRAYTSTVLGQDTSDLGTSGYANPWAYNVKAGDKVQIFFRIEKAGGVYDDNLKCNITYDYGLCYNDY